MEMASDHRQIAARDMVTEIELNSAKTGKIKLLSPAIKFSKIKATIRSQPPLRGENTNEVLEGYGVTANELEALEKEGVIKSRGYFVVHFYSLSMRSI